jgi:hypothetical protein
MESGARAELLGRVRDEKLEEMRLHPDRCGMRLDVGRRIAQPNRKSASATAEEEMGSRQGLAEGMSMVGARVLGPLLARLSQIPDPRDTRKIKHSLVSVLLYGVMMFAFNMSSRRDANARLSSPIFLENMASALPELETIPHADTLARLLEKTGGQPLEGAYAGRLRDLIREKKFRPLLRMGKYAVAVDGSQKFGRGWRWSEEALCRKIPDADREWFYSYVLDSVLILENGMTIPLLTETLRNEDWIPGATKQDCERKAFRRLAPRLRRLLGKNVVLLADGLYACEPAVSVCRSYGWDYMITLKEGCLPDTWEEAECQIAGGMGGSLAVAAGDRLQLYQWANDIGADILRPKAATRNVVFCAEEWVEEHPVKKQEAEKKRAVHAWLSSFRLTKANVARLCQFLARKRWCVENGCFHVEKHDGYAFEHCFSYNWDAMKGFHCLMKIGHFVNVMMQWSEIFAERVAEGSIKGFVARLWQAVSGALLDRAGIAAARSGRFQWRLSPTNVFMAPSG